MTGPEPKTVVAVGGAYAVAYILVTGVLPPPESDRARALLADLYLAIPTLVALVLASRAAARSLGPERAFWSLLAAACGAQVLNEATYSLRLFFPSDVLAVVGHAGYYTFNVLVGVALVVWPHRPLPASRAVGAVLDCLMVAVAAYFLVFYFIATPLGELGPSGFWILSGQQLLLAVGAAALTLSVRAMPYALVYRFLAGGFGAGLLLGLAPNWRYAHGHSDLYSPLNLDWIAMLFGIAAAAAVPRGPAWVQATGGSEAAARRARLAAGAAVVPAAVDLVARAAGLQPHLAAERTSLALAATAAVVALAALRLGRGARGTDEGLGVRLPGSERVHFASGVAHEVNNPLMAVAGWAELAVGRGEPRSPLEALLASTRRAAAIVTRLQQLGDAAVPMAANTAPAHADSGSLRLPAGADAARRRRWMTLWAAVAFAVLYFGSYALGAPRGTGDVLLIVPAGAAVAILGRRAAASRALRRVWFWRLLAIGGGLWVAAQVLWAGLEIAGARPASTPFTVLDTLYLGFLVPMIAAVALKPHGRERALDSLAAVDIAAAWTAVALLFVRVAILPILGLGAVTLGRRTVLATLAAVLAGTAIAWWRLAESPGWRRVYGYLAAFGITYGLLSAVANGLGGRMPPPGGPADLAWIVPFVLLSAGATRGFAASPGETPRALVILAPAALVLDLLVTTVWPDLSPSGSAWTFPLAAALAVFVALRLRLEVGAEARARRAARAAAEEEARAQRLTALASVAAAAVADLTEALEELCRQARAAAVILPDKGDVMLQQARRARSIVRELAASFHLEGPDEPRGDVDLTALVEEVVEGAVVDGLPLQVSLEGLAGIPVVPGDRRALRAAVSHLVRNAAHASPGGVLRIRASVEPRHVVLRFQDDGPGVPPLVRAQIFDPFFTTRRVGDGLGLGLTQVHFAARDHGGSIVLEDAEGGASFALRLPVRERRRETPIEASPYMVAALVAAAAAVALVVVGGPEIRTRVSVTLQIASALIAASGLAWAAVRHDGARRRFWALLAVGPLVWAVTRMLRVAEGGFDGRPGSGVWHIVLYILADLSLAAALLMRADRRRSDHFELSAGVGGALLLFAYAHANLVVLPDPFALTDPVLRLQLVIVRALQKVAIAVWALALGAVAGTRFWRGLYRRLGAVLLIWAAGQTLAFWFRSQPGYRGGSISDLGWIVPFLAMAAFGAREALRPGTGEPTVSVVAPPRVPLAAAWLVVLAGIVTFEAVFPSAAGHPALDAARTTLLRVMVIALALLFAAHEWLARRRPGTRRVERDPGPTRWARMVASAVHELGGHLSGIAAVNRLILTDPDLASRARSDAARVQERAEAASRVVHNLLAAVPASLGGRERISPNTVIDEALAVRRAALAQDGVVLAWRPGRGVPECILDPAALRHIVLGLLDRAAVCIRGAGRSGSIEVSTRAGEGMIHLRVCDDGRRPSPGRFGRLIGVLFEAPPDVEADLDRSHVRESVAREGGTLRAECRPGDTVITVSLPLVTPEPVALTAR